MCTLSYKIDLLTWLQHQGIHFSTTRVELKLYFTLWSWKQVKILMIGLHEGSCFTILSPFKTIIACPTLKLNFLHFASLSPTLVNLGAYLFSGFSVTIMQAKHDLQKDQLQLLAFFPFLPEKSELDCLLNKLLGTQFSPIPFTW